jgi:hypothetical protein
MDNPKKLAAYGTQDEDKQNQRHNTICVGHHYAQTQITLLIHEPSYKVKLHYFVVLFIENLNII